MRAKTQRDDAMLPLATRREVLALVHELGDCLHGLRLCLAMREVDFGTDPHIDQLYGIMMKLRWLTLARPRADVSTAVAMANKGPAGRGMAVTEDPGTVYVVDDDPSVRRSLSRLFRSLGHRVQAFPSASHFLAESPHARPACVVLDVRMPRMSGLDLQHELASIAPDLPIIFITGHGDIDMAVQAMKDGAVDFLPKPFDDQDLIDSVDRILDYDRRQMQKKAEQAIDEKRLALLSPREFEVFERVVKGMLNKQIGYELGTTEKTIKVHRARVMKKMAAESLADLVRTAERLNIRGPGSKEK